MARWFFVLLVFLPFSAIAHDLWLEKIAGGYVLYQGHRYSPHAGADVLAYEPTWVKAATCLDATGKPHALTWEKHYPVRLMTECAALSVAYSSGYWSKTAWETRNEPKTVPAGVIRSWLSQESVKRLERWTPASMRPLGVGLEIVPLGDPWQVSIGEKLIVWVSDNGQPRAGVPVAYHGEVRGTTDREGRIAIRIRQPGMQMLSASVEEALSDGKADTLIRATVLQWEPAP